MYRRIQNGYIPVLNFVGIYPLTEEASTRQLGQKSTVPLDHYHYFGEFPNMNPFLGVGAYHASELPLAVGTYGLTEPDDIFSPI
jgi:hypothetical protein